MLKENDIRLGNMFTLNLKKKLGSGSFGQIFLGTNLKSRQHCAIKLESCKSKSPQLEIESKILQYLQGGKGIPTLYQHGQCGLYNFMIIDLLGQNLEDLFNLCGRKFSFKTTLMLFDQMLSRLEFLHSRHIVHRDLKPENFVIGTGAKENQIYIIDFGLSKKFRDTKTGLHIPYKDGKSLVGTVRYTSIYTHLGIEQSRRDDLESLGYVIMYFLRGDLPWENIQAKSKEEKHNIVMEKKVEMMPEELYFVGYFHYCRGLQYDEKPDYGYIRSLINKCFEKNSIENDGVFDWMDKRALLKDGRNKNSIEQVKEKEMVHCLN